MRWAKYKNPFFSTTLRDFYTKKVCGLRVKKCEYLSPSPSSPPPLSLFLSEQDCDVGVLFGCVMRHWWNLTGKLSHHIRTSKVFFSLFSIVIPTRNVSTTTNFLHFNDNVRALGLTQQSNWIILMLLLLLECRLNWIWNILIFDMIKKTFSFSELLNWKKLRN